MTTFTARSAEDILALVPVVIGFEPEESVVMLTFGGRESFHARIDLPPPEESQECAGRLLTPALKHGVAQVVFVLYSAQERRVRRVARALKRRFDEAGVRVIDVLQAYDGRWFTPLGGSGVPVQGVPYDVTDHPFRARAVYEGHVLAASRAELVERLSPDPTAVAGVAAALGRVSGDLLDGAALRAVLDGHLLAGTVPDQEQAARILLAVHQGEVRDGAWLGMRRAEAERHVRLWTDLVRRAPEGLVAGAASVLAYAAWMQGDGALAWCAVDRCLDDDPEHSLGRIVADALERAVPPADDWESRFLGGIAG
jgi:hypothetical protein